MRYYAITIRYYTYTLAGYYMQADLYSTHCQCINAPPLTHIMNDVL